MRKCILCGKETDDSAVEVCPECGGEIKDASAEESIAPEAESSIKKPADKKKKTIIIASIIAFLVIAVAGTVIVINTVGNNSSSVSQTKDDEEEDDKKEQTEKADAQGGDDTAGTDSEQTSGDTAQEESGGGENTPDSNEGEIPFIGDITIPEDISLEDLIEEFNITTDPERKEELRLILEEIFKNLPELSIAE